jgi:hypothetical protein
VVVQGATLIALIIGTMFVLAAIVMGVVMVHMIDPAAVGQIGSDVLLVLEGMLEMHADQRHNACGLGE